MVYHRICCENGAAGGEEGTVCIERDLVSDSDTELAVRYLPVDGGRPELFVTNRVHHFVENAWNLTS